MKKKCVFFLLLFVLSSEILYSEESLKKEKVLSEEYYDLLFDKNKVGKVRLETYTAKYKGRDVFVIEEEMNAKFYRSGTEMNTYSKSRTLSNFKDLEPVGYWYESDEGGVKRNIMGLVKKEKNKKILNLMIDIGGTKTSKDVEVPNDAIFSNAFEIFIRRNLQEGFSAKRPLIMEADTDVVEGTTQIEKFEPIEACPNSIYKTTTVVAGIKNVELRDISGWPVCVIIPTMNVIFSRTDKKRADEGFTPIDIFEQSLIKPDKALKSINRLEKLVIKLTFNSLQTPEIIEDEYQKVIKKEGKSITLEIKRIRPDLDKKLSFPVSGEDFARYIQPTRYEQSNSPKIMELAQQFAGDETDIVEAAIKVSDKAGQYIKGASLSKGYLSALEVLEQRVGDCTEYSVLTSALLKSLGIPTRLVMGLVYVDGKFGFHSWLDYWAGKWYSIDPTLNEEAVNPTHIRLWTGIGEPSDLRGASTSALNFLNKVQIEILDAQYK